MKLDGVCVITKLQIISELCDVLHVVSYITRHDHIIYRVFKCESRH
jgi:hypothetical protein